MIDVRVKRGEPAVRKDTPMYPFIRMTKEYILARRQPPLPVMGEHVSHHICWPWDLDLWMELNNGRTLTIYDLGRIPAARRTGLVDVLARKRWGLTIAGSCVRYRRRVRMFDRIVMRSRLATWDNRFFYIEQSMWKRGECTSHALFRAAVTDSNGIVAPSRVAAEMPGAPDTAPPMPDWIAAWSSAEALRPWPPMQDAKE